MWVTRNSFPYKELLKSLNFRYASRKRAWYFHADEYHRRSKREVSLDEIREKYGSQKVNRACVYEAEAACLKVWRNTENMSSQILLTISILISNRPDTVRKCLDSVKPLLENVPSELILVDTGCGEQVRGIIEEYTDNIVDLNGAGILPGPGMQAWKGPEGKWVHVHGR